MWPQFATSFPPPPRMVSRKSGTGCIIWFLRLFIVPHMVAGVFFILAVPTHLYVHYLGTPVTATIDRIEPRTSKKSGDYYWVTYHYMLDGRRFSDGESRQVRPAVGDTFGGRAAAFAGHGMILAPEFSVVRDVLPLLGAAIFWNGVLSMFLYVLWVVPIRQHWLARHGEATLGTITGKVVHRGKSTTYTVSYQFDVDGKDYRGKCDVDSAAYDLAREGMPVTVLYDPSRPKRSLPYEVCDFVVIE
jgi:hypothetical protein